MTLFEGFLLELAKVLEFPTLAPDAKGACLIIIKEENIPLLFEFDEQLVPNTVLVSSLIAFFPMEWRSDIYEASLIGNHSIEHTLSVKPDEDVLYLHRRFHPLIQSEDLGSILSNFLDTVKLWKNRVVNILKEPPRSQQRAPHPASIQVFPFKA